MRHGLEAQRQRAGVQNLAGVVFAQAERVLDQVLVAPGADDATEAVTGAGRGMQLRAGGMRGAGPAVDGHGLLARRVGERVGERDEVEEVIGVQVRDDDRVDVHVVDEPAQLREDAVAAVEQQAEALFLDQISGAGAVDVLP